GGLRYAQHCGCCPVFVLLAARRAGVTCAVRIAAFV
ncbi:hypothetical protein A2U01_0103199, partial [Trifolium medium]|nr:hypothetical protein [Trifolium medium]